MKIDRRMLAAVVQQERKASHALMDRRDSLRKELAKIIGPQVTALPCWQEFLDDDQQARLERWEAGDIYRPPCAGLELSLHELTRQIVDRLIYCAEEQL